MEKIVIVGSGPAGLGACEAARRFSPKASITVITRDNYLAFAPCAMPLVWGKQISSIRNTVLRGLKHFLKLEVHLGEEVVGLDTSRQTLSTSLNKIKYDALVFATGKDPQKISVPGNDLLGVFSVSKSFELGLELETWFRNSNSVVIAKAGILGPEIAAYLADAGFKVTVFEDSSLLSHDFDKKFRSIIRKHVQGLGVLFRSDSIAEIRGKEQVESIITSDGDSMKCDCVVFTPPGNPNTQVLQNAGVKINEKGDVVTDSRMETSIENVFAAGTCVETHHFYTEERTRVLSAVPSGIQGKIAGANAVGKNIVYPGFMNIWIMQYPGNLQFGAVGVELDEARKLNLDVKVGIYKGPIESHFCSHLTEITLREIFDKKNERLIGVEAIGAAGIAERLDAAAIAIRNRYTLENMLYIDTAYFPNVVGFNEPLVITAANAI